MTLTVLNHLTLDGVLQGPGGPEEDTSDGFRHGGWAVAGMDTVMGEILGERMGRPEGALLLGRRSYEQMLGHWNAQGGPFRDALNAAPKYVASTDPDLKLAWPNSTLIHGDVPTAVAAIKQRTDLLIMGSGRLIRSLLPRRLIDELILMIHPIVLGSGRRLFDADGNTTPVRLIECTPTTTGVLMTRYRLA